MPKTDEIAYGMARDDTFVKQSAAVCPPVGDERIDGFHGDTGHIRGFMSLRSILVR